MTTPNQEPLETADEADVVEQSQDLDGGGDAGPGVYVPTNEADEADALEQGMDVTDEDEDDYPHQ